MATFGRYSVLHPDRKDQSDGQRPQHERGALLKPARDVLSSSLELLQTPSSDPGTIAVTIVQVNWATMHVENATDAYFKNFTWQNNIGAFRSVSC